MKRISLSPQKMLLLVAIVSMLSACGGGSGGNSNSTSPSPPAQQPLTWDSGKWDTTNWG